MASSSHGLSALRQETPARKTASASFPPPAPDSSRGTRLRAAPGTLPLPPLWAPWPVTVWAGGRPGGDDGPSPCRPARRYVKRNRPRSGARGSRGRLGGGATAGHAPSAASRERGVGPIPAPPSSLSFSPAPAPSRVAPPKGKGIAQGAERAWPRLSRARLSGAGPLEGVGRGLARGGAGPPDLRDLVGARPCGLLQPGLICALPAGSSNCDRGFFITS